MSNEQLEVGIMNTFRGHYSIIPAHTQAMLMNWYVYGIRGGDFLDAVLCGDLFAAYSRADDDNVNAMKAIVSWVYNILPMDARTGPTFADKVNMAKRLDDWKGIAE